MQKSSALTKKKKKIQRIVVSLDARLSTWKLIAVM